MPKIKVNIGTPDYPNWIVLDARHADTVTTIPSLSGDVTNSGNTIILKDSGVNAGTYSKVTVNSKGLITNGSPLTEADIPSISLDKITDAGTSASKNVGTSAGEIPILDVNGQLDSVVLPSSFGTVTASNFISTQTTGTSPFTISSTTLNKNLNADMVDGFHLNQDVSTNATPKFNGIFMDNSDSIIGPWVKIGSLSFYTIDFTTSISGMQLQSRKGDKTSYGPLFLNYNGGGIYAKDAILTDGNGNATFKTIKSTATSGSPLTIASSVMVPNLNADMIDGYHASSFWKNDSAPTERSFVRVTLNSNDSLPSTTTTKIKYNVVRDNHLSEWDGSGYYFRNSSAGIYAVTVSWSFDWKTDYSSYVAIETQINDVSLTTETRSRRLCKIPSISGNYDGTATYIVKLNAGDRLSVVYSVGQGTCTLSGVYDSNSLIVTRIA